MAAPAASTAGALEGGDVELEAGTMHYERAGHGGRVVVCVHGITMGAFAFRGLARYLAAQGFVVYTPDLLGCGHSKLKVLKEHTKAYFVDQLAEFLHKVGLWDAGPVMLVGHSMGGAVAAAFAVAHRAQVSRLVLVAPAGLPLRTPLAAKAVTMPVLGGAIFYLFGKRAVIKARDGDFYVDCEGKQICRDNAVWSTEHTPLFLESTRSIIQSFGLSGGYVGEFADIGKADLPVLQVWGDRDTTCDAQASVQEMKALMPKAQFTVIPNVGHQPLFESPQETEKIIGAFLA
jgi:pimeloyl-ACP methyl ester carboxylesterase